MIMMDSFKKKSENSAYRSFYSLGFVHSLIIKKKTKTNDFKRIKAVLF